MTWTPTRPRRSDKTSEDQGHFAEGEPKGVARHPALSEAVARELVRAIQDGRLPPGSRLPSEQALIERYGVSRSVVREAISRLKGDGLVHSQQGRGAFVAEATERNVFRLPPPDLANKRELESILELLIAFEVAATALAAKRRSRPQLAAIRRALDGMARAIEEGRSGVDEDLTFHNEIVRATGNPFFIDLAGVFENRARKLIRTARTNTARFDGLAHLVQKEHEAIYRAIEQADQEEARAAAERHLRNAAARLRLYQSDEARSQARASRPTKRRSG